MEYRTVNPTTGELIESFPNAADADADRALDAATAGFATWSKSPFAERRELLRSLAQRLEGRATSFAETMALEMGKPLAEGEAEAKKCAWVCRYYAEEGERALAPDSHESDGSEAYVRYDALGPILAIMPWNFPFWQVFRFMAPAIAAGNVTILKHAPGVPRCALAISDLMKEAGTPEGVFQNLFLGNDQAARVIRDPRIQGVTLTGSSRAGKQVGAVAGGNLKTMVMELGGSDPFIVFADADLDEAAEVGALARCINSGQSCVSAKRFLVERSAFDDFEKRFIERLSTRKVGDPTDRSVQIGPLARKDLKDDLVRQVSESVAAGAEVVFRGEAPDGPGFFYPVSAITKVTEEMPAYSEELFGPAAVLLPFDDEDRAVSVANDTSYGLGASLWTSDRSRAERLIPRIEAGAVFINGLVKSDPRIPFGGIKESGFGRELAYEGLREFVNRKTVWIK